MHLLAMMYLLSPLADSRILLIVNISEDRVRKDRLKVKQGKPERQEGRVFGLCSVCCQFLICSAFL